MGINDQPNSLCKSPVLLHVISLCWGMPKRKSTYKKHEYLKWNNTFDTVPLHLLRKWLECVPQCWGPSWNVTLNGNNLSWTVLRKRTFALCPQQGSLIEYHHSPLPNQSSCSQVHVLNQSHTTLVFINLFTATCFGYNYEPPSGLLQTTDTGKITYCIRRFPLSH